MQIQIMMRLLSMISTMTFTIAVSSSIIGQDGHMLSNENLEDGFYVVSKTGLTKEELKPLTETQRIITYNEAFLDSENDPYLVIEAADFVALNLKERPISQQQEDATQNFYITLNDDAKMKLEKFTRLNLYKTTAIVVNGEAYTKHKIKSVIDGGTLQITQCSDDVCRKLYDQFEDNIVGLPSALDWANLQRFEKQNEEDKMKEITAVFMGNSITEGWLQKGLQFFDNPAYINRGIGGQTTPQMLVRFRPDVIDLNPKAVVILAGINDIAGNTGPMNLESTFNNIKSMAELAHANHIKVVICSLLPAYDFPWNPGLAPAEKVVKLNAMLKAYCLENGFEYVDYFSALADDRNGLPKEYSEDEVHPTVEAYKIMEVLVQEGIDEALD